MHLQAVPGLLARQRRERGARDVCRSLATARREAHLPAEVVPRVVLRRLRKGLRLCLPTRLGEALDLDWDLARDRDLGLTDRLDFQSMKRRANRLTFLVGLRM